MGFLGFARKMEMANKEIEENTKLFNLSVDKFLEKLNAFDDWLLDASFRDDIFKSLDDLLDHYNSFWDVYFPRCGEKPERAEQKLKSLEREIEWMKDIIENRRKKQPQYLINHCC